MQSETVIVPRRLAILGLTLLLSTVWVPRVSASVLYVDDDALGANSGQNWQDAFVCLQDALMTAQNAPKPLEIHVAQGMYKPDQRLVKTHRYQFVQASGDRTATFQLVDGASILGGFAGLLGDDPNAHNVETYKTILSGDLQANDQDVNDPQLLLNDPNRAENSVHVVIGSNTGPTALLDGFVITGGDARNDHGGGVFVYDGRPAIQNCTFQLNYAELGGGVYVQESNKISFKNCLFIMNGSGDTGGGIYTSESTVVLDACVFQRNWAILQGGGLIINGGDTTLLRCDFSQNSTLEAGGGAKLKGSSYVALDHCRFMKNTTIGGGGGLTCDGCLDIQLQDCLFQNNVADGRGGGLLVDRSHIVLIACQFQGNTGNGLDVKEKSEASLVSCVFTEHSRGAAVQQSDHSALMNLVDCEFRRNSDGGLNSSGAGIELNSCRFIENTAHYGAGMSSNEASKAQVMVYGVPTLVDCVFSGNSALEEGGGIIMRGYGNLRRCAFENNHAKNGGGAKTQRIRDVLWEDCTFENNTASDSGGGIYNKYGYDPSYRNCKFINNRAVGYGGGVYDDSEESTYINCVFVHNSATNGGGLNRPGNDSVSLVNCSLLGNRASDSGGGMYCGTRLSRLTNCLVVGNSAKMSAAIMDYKSTLNLVNCVLAANCIDASGLILNISSDKSTIENCIIWGNRVRDVSHDIVPQLWGSDGIVTSSCIEGGLDGAGNISRDPLFVRVPNDGGDGWGDNPDTPETNEAANDDFGNLWLQAGSPCINGGDNSGLPMDTYDLDGDGDTDELLSIDLDGSHRIVNNIVDIGAYEYHGISAIYVDARATGSNGGGNWSNAYPNLQDALAAAGDRVKPIEIRVAQGSYRPDLGVNQTAGDRESSFQLINWVTIKGGYAGIGTANLDVRDVHLYATIFSGDLRENDSDVAGSINLSNRQDRLDNSYHVVTASGTDYSAILEGVTVYGGQANGFGQHRQGGGLLMENGSPTLANCHFLCNSALTGGGLYGLASSAQLTNCVFTENGVASLGGGLYADDCIDLSLTDCTFVKNTAQNDGGGAYYSSSAATQIRCKFVGNWAGDHGGALYSDNCDPRLEYCVFNNNSSSQGGGVFSHKSDPVLVGCTFRYNQANEGAGLFSQRLSYVSLANCLVSQNKAQERGGGFYNQASDIELTNCTVLNNVARWQGGGLYNANSDVTLTNSILWANLAPSDPELSFFQSTVDLQGTYCNVRGGLPVSPGIEPRLAQSGSNLDQDPRLTPDGHLTADSPCIDAGNNYALTANEGASLDWDGDARFHDDPNAPDTGIGLNSMVDIGADEFVDSDGDRLPDWWERKYFGDPNAAEAEADSDGDGLSNLEEYERYSSNPKAQPIYVEGTAIQSGLDAAQDGDTVVVLAGSYRGQGNRDLDFGGKSIVLLAPDGPEKTQIDCESRARAFDFHSGESAASAVVGFRITNGLAEQGGAIRCEQASPQFRNCVFEDNHDTSEQAGTLYGWLSYPILADCTFQASDPNSLHLEHSGIVIEGTTRLASERWTGQDVMFTGSGILELKKDATLALKDAQLRCDITGAGIVQVPLGGELVIEGNARIDLAGDANDSGWILCDGLLILRDNAQIANTRITVTRASIENQVVISNSVITAEARSPYGQFYVEGTAQITGNEIHADGDRYLDLDPEVFEGLVTNNRIYVTITEGKNNSLGGLLELRGRDLADPPCGADQFLCPLAQVPAFDITTWTIERLELTPGAKVNLTNRFDFGNGDLAEVMYVKQLVLGEDSVLNTAFNRLYYEAIEPAPSARIIDVPLLGFSLNNISFDHPDDFISRVVHNNFSHAQDTRYDRAHVQRIIDQVPDPAGMMVLRVLQERDPESPNFGALVSARAKGLFSKSSEARVLVTFEYLFETDLPGTELVVYLSDIPQLQEQRDPDHHIEIGRILPPRRGRPGSVDSGRFGRFHTYAPRGLLNFIRGTRVELELAGPINARVLIDNWDPQIMCDNDECMNLDGEIGVTADDLKPLLGGFGSSARLDSDGTGSECLDGILSGDGHVGCHDIVSGEWAINNEHLTNLCPDTTDRSVPLSPVAGLYQTHSHSTTTTQASAPNFGGLPGYGLVILGKVHNQLPDYLLIEDLYLFSTESQTVSSLQELGPAPYNSGNIKLVRGKDDGAIYQVNIETGISRLNQDGSRETLLASGASYPVTTQGRYHQQGGVVYVGLQPQSDQVYGRPIWDAAITKDSVYVVPVVVQPTGAAPYQAAARFQRAGTKLELTALYDDPNFFDVLAPDNPDLSGLCEIEVDDQGTVYITNSQGLNASEMLWKYDADGSLLDWIELTNPMVPSSPLIPDPVGLCVVGNRLYLSSGLNMDQRPNSVVYAFSTADLSLQGTFTLQDLAHVTDITADGSGNLWVVGLNVDNQALEKISSWIDVVDAFYEPRIASIQASQLTLESGEVTAESLQGNSSLGLPLSVVWVAE